MKRALRWIAIALAVLLLLVTVGPFLVPVPELEGTVAAQELAYPNSEFLTIGDLTLHVRQWGQGELQLILLHGFASSTFTWRAVAEPLGQSGRVVAFDRPSSGLTERPMPGDWQGESPYSREAQADLTVGLMDTLGIDEAILVGNSAGGTIAALTALRHPERVQALVLVDPAIYEGGGAPGWILPLLRTPQMQRIGPLAGRFLRNQGERLLSSAWHDPSLVTPEMEEGYLNSFRVDDWDKGLWQLTVASKPSDIADRLDELTLPTLVITGDDDRIVPTDLSIRLAGELPNAELVVIPNCGHVPQEECPEPFLEATEEFVSSLQSTDSPHS